jgi:predicted transcriptional regulator
MTAIKLKVGELAILKSIAHAPRTAHSMTHVQDVADVALAPHVVRAYLDHLAELGLIEAPQRQDGHYHVTAAGLEYLAELPQVVPSTLICNASMTEPYRTPRSYQRETGPRYPSRGMGT